MTRETATKSYSQNDAIEWDRRITAMLEHQFGSKTKIITLPVVSEHQDQDSLPASLTSSSVSSSTSSVLSASTTSTGTTRRYRYRSNDSPVSKSSQSKRMAGQARRKQRIAALNAEVLSDAIKASKGVNSQSQKPGTKKSENTEKTNTQENGCNEKQVSYTMSDIRKELGKFDQLIVKFTECILSDEMSNKNACIALQKAQAALMESLPPDQRGERRRRSVGKKQISPKRIEV